MQPKMKAVSGLAKAAWLLATTALLGVFSMAGAADPHGAVYSGDASRLLWIMHISDTHIGTEWYNEDDRFSWGLQDAVFIIQPDLIVNTGDLCDGSINGIPATGQGEDEWSLYRQIVDDAGMTVDYYIDIPGNHDLYGDPGLSFYLGWSLNGSTFGATTRSLLMEFSFGKYFIYGCATPGEDGKIFVDTHEFSQAELEEMQAELTANDDSRLIFVFGHHPPNQPDNAEQAREIMKEHNAIYFHGHSHVYDEYLYNDILTFEVDSLGKATNDNLAVIAVDNDYVAYDVTSSDDPWPFIVVTAPADVRLKSGDEHPYAYPVCNTGEANPVRALVFDAAEVTEVTCRLGDGPGTALVQDQRRPMLWTGFFDSRGFPEGEVELTVAATGSQQRSRTIRVLLADVPCLDAVEPDGGVQDGGDGDANDFPERDEVDPGDSEAEDRDAGGDDAGIGDIGAGDAAGADDAPLPADEPDAGGGVLGGGGCMCESTSGPGLFWPGLLVLLGVLRQRERRLPADPSARHTG
jgi:metallophosphoesterase superfamily enzyme